MKKLVLAVAVAAVSVWCSAARGAGLLGGSLLAYESEDVALDALADAERAVGGEGREGWELSAAAEVEEAIRRMWTRLAEALVSAYRRQGVESGRHVHRVVGALRRELQELQDSLTLREGLGDYISPAFQWAQSPDSVFLNVKFAHRWDAPATLGCSVDSFVVVEQWVNVSAACEAKRKRFLLSLDLHAPVDAERSSWASAAVGRATLTLRKAENSSWPNLLDSDAPRLANMHVWWDKRKAHEQEMKDWQAGAGTSTPTTTTTTATPPNTPPTSTQPLASDDTPPAESPAFPAASPAPAAAAAAPAPGEEARARAARERQRVEESVKERLAEIERRVSEAKEAADATARRAKADADRAAAEERVKIRADAAMERDRIRRELDAQLDALAAQLGLTSKDEL
jgi:hypothetical protein